VPFATAWIGDTLFASIPMAIYGVILLMSAFAYGFLVQALRAAPGQTDTSPRRSRNDRKGRLSPVIYATAIPISFFAPLVSFALYWTVAAMWIVPDPRIERRIGDLGPGAGDAAGLSSRAARPPCSGARRSGSGTCPASAPARDTNGCQAR
jgi:ABC-type Fe3+ transport system permease subunit